jgi:hypothetical protein
MKRVPSRYEVAATSAEMLAVVRRWARARGYLHQPKLSDHNGRRIGWHVTTDPLIDGHLVQVWERFGSHALDTKSRLVTPAVALAWALLVESDAAPVYVGKCSAPNCDGIGWYWGYAIGDHETDNRYTCDACSGTGDELTPVAVLMLDAATGDERARELLAMHPDKLLADGNPLGMLLTWVLNLWSRESVDMPCSTCDTIGTLQLDFITVACPSCSTGRERGTGRMLGHPHTAEAVRWLEWLLWGNWFVEQQRHHVLVEQARDVQRMTQLEVLSRADARELLDRRLVGHEYDTIIVDDVIVQTSSARQYTDSLFAEQTFGNAGETITVNAGEHVYSMRLTAPTTAYALALAFNQQGGPVSFTANETGLTVGMRDEDTTSYMVSTAIDSTADLLDFVEPTLPEEPRRRHAAHIGSRLGRRLGVRR